MVQLHSPAFRQNEAIPTKYTCEGNNCNPPLIISAAPPGTKSLVLIVDDPDAAIDPQGPGKIFDHWVLFNIDPSSDILENSVPAEATPGINSAGTLHYVGPCPPTGQHYYQFTLYALDTRLGLAQGSTKEQVLAAMSGHILDSTVLTGTYERHTTAEQQPSPEAPRV